VPRTNPALEVVRRTIWHPLNSILGLVLVIDHASPFELRGANNSNLGAIAASGVFLTENGKAGSVQEIGLSV
jgi:hypothetical protein